MKRYKRIIVMIMFILILLLLTNFCYAKPIEVTEEKLRESFKELEKNNKDYKSFNVNDKQIIFSSDKETYNVDYDLDKEPTFSTTISVKKGMTYEEFKKLIGLLQFPALGYMAVANIQGETLENAVAYISIQVLGDALSNGFTADSYVILDDTNSGTMQKGSSSKIIYASEFGDRVMEYVNSVYASKQTIEDKEIANTFTWTIERTNVTETSCDIVSKLVVNLDGDFSKIKEANDSIAEDIFGQTNDNKGNETNTLNKNKANEKNELASLEGVPYLGTETNIFLIVLYIIIAIATISLMFMLTIRKKNA